MKKIILFFCLTLTVNYLAKGKGFMADSLKVKVGFEKDTIRINEGKFEKIIFNLEGIIPKDSLVVVKFEVTDSDATLSKDYTLPLGDEFTFVSSKNTLQSGVFEIKTIADLNVENEKLTILMTIIKGKKLITLKLSKCVVFIQDPKSEFQLQKEAFTSMQKEIFDKVEAVVNKDKDTSEVIGTLKLLNQTHRPKLFKKCRYNKGFNRNVGGEEQPEIQISKVDIVFKHGVAINIRAFVKGSDEVYSNLWYDSSKTFRKRYGVSFRHIDITDRYDYYKLIGEKEACSNIQLSKLLTYTGRTGLNFMPSDTMVTLVFQEEKKEPVKKVEKSEADGDAKTLVQLKAEIKEEVKAELKAVAETKKLKAPELQKADIYARTSLSSYINFNVYTDVLSLLNINNGNGIIQSDASAKIYLTTLPWKNSLKFNFHYLMPYARYARFENGFENVPTIEGKSFEKTRNDVINRMAVNQRKFFDLGLKLNVQEWISKFDNTYEMNVFMGIGWFNRQGKELKSASENGGVVQYESLLTNTFEYGLELRSSILQYRNFGINMGFMTLSQKILNAKDAKVTDGGFKGVYRTEAELFYYPIKKIQDKIFLRTYYTFSGSPAEAGFARVQMGYKALFKIKNKVKQ